jgi:hypothetical protein
MIDSKDAEERAVLIKLLRALRGFLAALLADGAVKLLATGLYLVGFEHFAAHPTSLKLFFRYYESLLFNPRFQQNHCLNTNASEQ